MPPEGNQRPAVRLTPQEDAALRRWHYFHTLGFTLSQPVDALQASLRARDNRSEIRAPRDVVEPAGGGVRRPTNRAGRPLR